MEFYRRITKSYLDYVEKFVTLILESRASYLTALVDEVHGEELALAPRIAPSSHARLVADPGLYHPSVKVEKPSG